MRHILHRIKSTLGKFRFTTPVATIVGLALIAASIVAHGVITSGGSPSAPQKLFTGKAPDALDITEGKAKSSVVVIEYSDPECPFCITAYPSVKQLRAEYKDKVTFIYRHFPLTQIHPHAFDESKAITCAQTVGGNEQANAYIDAIYGYKASKQSTQLPATGKEDLAKNIGLDAKEFATCMKDQKSASAVDASLADGVTAGVTGTPTTFVLEKTRKGYVVVGTIEGARPYSYFKAAVEEALAR